MDSHQNFEFRVCQPLIIKDGHFSAITLEIMVTLVMSIGYSGCVNWLVWLCQLVTLVMSIRIVHILGNDHLS